MTTADSTTPASSVAATAVEALNTTENTVNVGLSMPIALAAFDEAAQTAVRTSLAVAAGLQGSDYTSVALAYYAAPAARRLLAEGVAINATINMPNASSATDAVNLLTADSINAQLNAAGLPSAAITTEPSVVIVSGMSPAARASPPSAAALGAAFAALGLSMRLAGPASACR